MKSSRSSCENNIALFWIRSSRHRAAIKILFPLSVLSLIFPNLPASPCIAELNFVLQPPLYTLPCAQKLSRVRESLTSPWVMSRAGAERAARRRLLGFCRRAAPREDEAVGVITILVRRGAAAAAAAAAARDSCHRDWYLISIIVVRRCAAALLALFLSS